MIILNNKIKIGKGYTTINICDIDEVCEISGSLFGTPVKTTYSLDLKISPKSPFESMGYIISEEEYHIIKELIPNKFILRVS